VHLHTNRWTTWKLNATDQSTGYIHPFNGTLSGTTWVSRYEKGKTNLDFTEARGSGISWDVCKSAPCSRQITTPAHHHSAFLQAGCPSCCPTNSATNNNLLIYWIGRGIKTEKHSRVSRKKYSTRHSWWRTKVHDDDHSWIKQALSCYLHHEAEKNGTNFVLCACLLILDRNRWIFSHILRKV